MGVIYNFYPYVIDFYNPHVISTGNLQVGDVIIATIREDNSLSWKTIERVGFSLIEKKMYRDINDATEELYRFYTAQSVKKGSFPRIQIELSKAMEMTDRGKTHKEIAKKLKLRRKVGSS